MATTLKEHRLRNDQKRLNYSQTGDVNFVPAVVKRHTPTYFEGVEIGPATYKLVTVRYLYTLSKKEKAEYKLVHKSKILPTICLDNNLISVFLGLMAMQKVMRHGRVREGKKGDEVDENMTAAQWYWARNIWQCSDYGKHLKNRKHIKPYDPEPLERSFANPQSFTDIWSNDQGTIKDFIHTHMTRRTLPKYLQ